MRYRFHDLGCMKLEHILPISFFLINFYLFCKGLAAHVAILKICGAQVAGTMATKEDDISLPLHADATAVDFLELLQPCFKLPLSLTAGFSAAAQSFRDWNPPRDWYTALKAALHAPTALRAVQMMATGLEPHFGISFKADLANASVRHSILSIHGWCRGSNCSCCIPLLCSPGQKKFDRSSAASHLKRCFSILILSVKVCSFDGQETRQCPSAVNFRLRVLQELSYNCSYGRSLQWA